MKRDGWMDGTDGQCDYYMPPGIKIMHTVESLVDHDLNSFIHAAPITQLCMYVIKLTYYSFKRSHHI